MAVTNRSAIIKKAFKVLKNHYTPYVPTPGRGVLENLLFACCLENSDYQRAEEGFARVQTTYYDWNEIRVTTVRELAESFDGVADPVAAARNLKKTLQSVFESLYQFDLEELRKQNLGNAIKQLAGFAGTTPFTVSYAVQQGLGGHAIPVSQGALQVLHVVGAIDDREFEQHSVPGLERAISKSKGNEFGSVLHQVGTEFHSSPFSTRLRSILLEIAPDAQERLPKRASKKGTAKGSGKKADAASDKRGVKKAKTGSSKATSTKATSSKATSSKATSAKTAKKKSASSPTGTKKRTKSKPTTKRPTKKGSTAKVDAKAKKKTPTKRKATKKKSSTKQLARRKPR